MSTGVVITIDIAAVVIVCAASEEAVRVAQAIIHSIIVALTITLSVAVGWLWSNAGTIMSTSVVITIDIAAVVIVRATGEEAVRVALAIIHSIVIALTIALNVWWWLILRIQ